MTPILLALALSAFALGFYLGREAGKAPGLTACPKCRQQRLYYCRGCGIHFDEKDEPISQRDRDRWDATQSILEGAKRDERQ